MSELMIRKMLIQDSAVKEDNHRTLIRTWNKTDHKNSSIKENKIEQISLKIKRKVSQLLTPKVRVAVPWISIDNTTMIRT